jgi:hypothetical protein
MAELEGTDRVPTWWDGVILPAEEKAKLTPAQWRQYSDDSVVRDLADIDQMPEPLRSWAHDAVEQARERAKSRIAAQERRAAS